MLQKLCKLSPPPPTPTPPLYLSPSPPLYRPAYLSNLGHKCATKGGGVGGGEGGGCSRPEKPRAEAFFNCIKTTGGKGGKGGGKGRDRLFKARRAAVICVSSFVIDKPRHLTQLYTHSWQIVTVNFGWGEEGTGSSLLPFHPTMIRCAVD